MSTVSDRLPPDRRFEFESDACPSDTFAVVRMSGFEAISRPYRFELTLVSDDARIDFAKVLGAGASLRILAPDDTSRATPYAGMLAEFDQLHQAGGFTFYRAVLVPRLWRLSQYRNSEVYLNEQTIPEIVEVILQSAKLSPSRDYTLKLTAQYRPRSYVCQYQETPLAFISRWLEREGIYYTFDQSAGHDQLVLLDDKVAQPPSDIAVNYRPSDALDVGLAPDSVQAFLCRNRPLPRTLVLQDYNHRRAGTPLVVQAEVSASGVGEEMLYGENFRSEEEGRRYARLRVQELLCAQRVFNGEATAVGLRSGHFMALSNHYREDFNGRYLVTEITHEGSQAAALLAGMKTPFDERDGHTAYRNNFVALPAATQFRPARTTPRPRVSGTMNATIDAEGSGEYAELDAYGQYKVQIPFDRTDKGAAKGSAPVRMASPYAGSDHGMHFPLHKGAEVLLSFTDGDPDQPVILGAVPNSVNPNVVDQRNPHLNLISTKGGNQVHMSDSKGKEVIWLNSPFHKSSIGIGSVHPDGGGSIYEATTGGRDSVSFGNNNSMSFGPSNSLSLGSATTLGASFSNDVSIGAKIGIDASSGVSWRTSLGQIGSYKGLMSLSIDDSESVSLSRSFGGSSSDTAVIAAGALASDITKLDLEASLTILRRMIGGYTALNFVASTVFSMAVNGSADGLMLAPAQKEEKAAQDKKDSDFADSEAVAKKIEIDKLGPAPAVTDAVAYAKWAAEQKAIEDKYTARAAAHAAPSNPDRQTLQGWPGIIGKFGFDAVSNITAMALIQAYGRKLQAKIEALKLVSKMALGKDGITQSVNGDGAPQLAGLVRCEFALTPSNGALLEVGSQADWANIVAATKFGLGTIAMKSNAFNVYAAGAADITSPTAAVGSIVNTKMVGLVVTAAGDKAALSSTGATVVAEGTGIALAAATIEIGNKKQASALGLAEAAVKGAKSVKDGIEKALAAAVKGVSDARALPVPPLLPGVPDGRQLAIDQAELLHAGVAASLRQAQETLNKFQLEEAKAKVDFTLLPLMHGLTIDDSAAKLTFGAAGWKASNTGLEMNFGNATAAFTAAGASLDGTTIKLG